MVANRHCMYSHSIAMCMLTSPHKRDDSEHHHVEPFIIIL